VASLAGPARRNGLLHRALQPLLVRVVPPHHPTHTATPIPWRARILAGEGIGEIDLAVTGCQIRLMELLDPAEVVIEQSG